MYILQYTIDGNRETMGACGQSTCDPLKLFYKGGTEGAQLYVFIYMTKSVHMYMYVCIYYINNKCLCGL